MKRFLLILLCICMLLSLMACSVQDQIDQSELPESSICTTESENTESTDENTAYADYYAGKPAELLVTYQDYEYRYVGRDRRWESDIIYTVRMLLKTHPALKDGYIHTKTRLGKFIWLNQNEYYDGELRSELIMRTEQLLDAIPTMEDYELTMELERLVALLSDVHTWINTIPDEVLPISVEQLDKNGQVGFFVVCAPRQQCELLFCRLTAINGYPIEEVIDLLIPYVGTENEYGLLSEIVEQGLDALIVNYDALCAIGVADPSAQCAMLTLEDYDGNNFTVELEAVPYEDADADMIKKDYFSNRIGLHARQYEENYWYEEWPDDHAIYFRIAACVEMEDYSMKNCCEDILSALESAEEPMKLIIDLRHNGGGYYPLDGMLEFMLAIDAMTLDGVFILIDGHCYSATTYFAANFRKYIPDAIFIGTPLGQPQGFFAGAQWSSLPESNWKLAISTVYSDRLPDLSGETFLPDILCYPNWEDYVNGEDTHIKIALQWQQEAHEVP